MFECFELEKGQALYLKGQGGENDEDGKNRDDCKNDAEREKEKTTRRTKRPKFSTKTGGVEREKLSEGTSTRAGAKEVAGNPNGPKKLTFDELMEEKLTVSDTSSTQRFKEIPV